VWRLGGCAVPLDGRLTPAELARLIEVAAPRFSLIDETVADAVLPALPPSVEVVDAGEAPPPADPAPDAARPGDDALVLFTSGSSGTPKGVVHTHASLRARWTALRARLGLEAYARTLCLLPTHFGHGLICNCLFPWLAGQDLFVTPPFRPDLLTRLGALVDEHEITFLSSVPAVWRLALKVARPPRRAPLARVHCGSAPLPATLWSGIQRWAGTPEVFNTYGLTETGSWVAGTTGEAVTPLDGLIGEPWGATFSVRRTADATALARDDGRCAPGETGHVWVATPALMRGYLGQEALTKRVMVDGQFATGDLGLLDERGRLHLRGRERDEINKGGLKIAPAEIDAAAEGCPQVADVCAFAVDDPLYGQNVGVAVTLVAPEDETGMGDLYRWMRERLSETKLPARWWRLDALPRSERGKVSRDAVREACADRPPVDLARLVRGR
jgi:acyl-CoA synthetase (AMP-forming)/AMP-acid ligase II